MKDTSIGIIMTTYQREDGKSPNYLKVSLDSIFSQTYKNFKLFLIGDKYENESELKSILKNYDGSKIYFENLPYAKERDKYSGETLWFSGGINAMNHGIDVALSQNFEYLCHLDHDDFWHDNHLEVLNKCIHETKSDWICTKSSYKVNRILPETDDKTHYVNFLPQKFKIIHSSTCINFKKIPLRYVNLFEEKNELASSDADLWERCRDYIEKYKLKSTLVNVLTCRHDEEGYERFKN
jgi:glycosyltransferase involved in cell wall biosynthesis